MQVDQLCLQPPRGRLFVIGTCLRHFTAAPASPPPCPGAWGVKTAEGWRAAVPAVAAAGAAAARMQGGGAGGPPQGPPSAQGGQEPLSGSGASAEEDFLAGHPRYSQVRAPEAAQGGTPPPPPPPPPPRRSRALSLSFTLSSVDSSCTNQLLLAVEMIVRCAEHPRRPPPPPPPPPHRRSRPLPLFTMGSSCTSQLLPCQLP